MAVNFISKRWKSRCSRGERSGFTLIELLVVIAIIGVLMAIAVPAVQSVRNAALRTQCSNNLRQIGLAAQNYQSSFRAFPPGIVPNTAPLERMRNSTWLTHLLPQIEQQNLYDNARERWNAGVSPFTGHIGMQTSISTYECPSVRGAANPNGRTGTGWSP